MAKQHLPLCAFCVGGAVLMSQIATAQVAPTPPQAKDRPAPRAKEDRSPRGAQKSGEAPRVTRKPAVADDAKDARDAAKNRAQDTRDAAKDTAKDTRDNAKERAKDAGDRAKDAGDRAKDTAKETRDTAKQRADDARDNVKNRTKETRDAAKDGADDARDTAKRTRDNVKDRAKDAGDDAKDVAKEGQESAKQQARKFDAEKVKPDDLGVTLKDSNDGVTISDVSKQSAFVDAGFQSGDQIVSINGQNITRQSDFISYLFAPNVVSVGRVPVVVMRNGTRDTVYVQPRTIIRNYETVVYQGRSNSVRDFGLVVDGRDDDRVYVERVIKGSRADAAGIQVDDQILAVNEQQVETPSDLRRLLDKYDGERVDMEVSRDREAQLIEVNVLR